MFEEMKQIRAVAQPDFSLFVMDSSIGQAAESQAIAFKEAVPIGGIILTKMDGSSKGGGALSAVAATGASVCFIGTGEHMYDFEAFNSRSFVGKLLGMGDVSGMMEKMSDLTQVTSQEKMMAMAERMNQGVFTLQDLYEQLKMMLSLGPMSKMMAMMPGMNSDLLGGGKDEDITKRFRAFTTCMDSMTKEEMSGDGRLFTTHPSRLKRVARGSGTNEETVQELLLHYRKFAQFIKKMGGSKGGLFQNLSQMPGMPSLESLGSMDGFDMSQMMQGMGPKVRRIRGRK